MGSIGTNGQGASPVTSIEEFTQTPFDFIICGGGTAGCAIAARLTENPNVKVGIIEAGKYRIGDPAIEIPAAFFSVYENPEYDWCLYTSPQKANHGKRHHLPRGKLLGGSSGINFQLYVRGSCKDYDDWAALAGDEGWSWETMKEYMRKHETLEPVHPSVADNATPLMDEFHGTSGPIRTSLNEAQLPIEADIINACNEVTGYTNMPNDAWSGDHIGFYRTLGSIARTGPRRGKRSYAAQGYYEDNSSRENLKLLCEARVNNVILDGTKATGVSLNFEGRDYQIFAKNEIIVCGGTIQSPQILELSGIGDPAVLEAAGVECKVKNTAVGANTQDHSLTVSVWELEPGIMSLDTLNQVPEAMQAAMKEYMETGSGPMSSIGAVQGFLPAKSIMSEEELATVIKSIKETKPTTDFHAKQLAQIIEHLQSDESANLQLVVVPATFNVDGIEHQSKLFPPPGAGKPPGVTLALCLQYPVSRGYVHIESADPAKPPVINPNYVSHEADVAVLAAFLRWSEKVGLSPHLKSSFARRSIPGPEVDANDLEAAKQAVRDIVVGEYHICGSVAMGDALDARLRVKGVEGLRVADASIFPNNISGNLLASVYAIAEKAADLIKEDWGLATPA